MTMQYLVIWCQLGKHSQLQSIFQEKCVHIKATTRNYAQKTYSKTIINIWLTNINIW